MDKKTIAGIDHKTPIGVRYGDKNVANKRFHQNPKYSQIKSTVKTGRTIKDVEIISDKAISKRRGELFKRIKRSTLAKLLNEQTFATESIYKLGEDEESKELMAPPTEGDDKESIYSYKSGISQVSAVTYATDQLGITSESTFLLLDLRDNDEFSLYHIVEAINYPAPNITRDKLIPQLYNFKNKKDRLIICYMEDERKGVEAAKLFVEKGYENLYLISGGIELFMEEYPELLEGKRPPILAPPKKDKVKAGKGQKIIRIPHEGLKI